ncbi:MAG: tRNA(Ile)-lysidine synthase [Pseudomonadota bacterium]|jgi:tRNA(Ile)-lysidine synthase
MIKKIKTQTNKTFVNKIDEVLQNIFEKNFNTSKKEFTNSSVINNNHLSIAIAVSGGSDSLALFFLLLDFCQNRNIKIHALSIDHKMRANSSIEVKKLANLLKKYQSNDNFCHNILTLSKNKIPQKNIEAKLRELRYELLGKYCQKNNIKLLFLGHQLNDIAENFLIRLFRGSSIDGLSSLKEISNLNDLKLIRPLLNFTKKDLQEYLISRNISWFEDETNLDEKFLRNKIRNFLTSFEDGDLLQKRIKNTADYFLEMRDFFEEKVKFEMANIVNKIDDSSYLINRKKLATINKEIAQKIIGKIIIDLSNKNYMPRRIKLENFFEYLIYDKQLKPRSFSYCLTKKVNNDEVLIYLNNKF